MLDTLSLRIARYDSFGTQVGDIHTGCSGPTGMEVVGTRLFVVRPTDGAPGLKEFTTTGALVRHTVFHKPIALEDIGGFFLVSSVQTNDVERCSYDGASRASSSTPTSRGSSARPRSRCARTATSW